MLTNPNIEIEEATLGILLQDPQSVGSLCADDFTSQSHRLIFEAIQIAAAQGGDIATVQAELTRGGQLEAVGGWMHVVTLMDSSPHSASLARYSAFLKSEGIRRGLRQKAAQIAKIAMEAETAAEALDLAEAEISSLRQRQPQGMATMTDAMKSYFKALELKQQAGGGITGVATGFADLDRITCGLQPGEMILVAARPSMGKTALSLSFAEAAAKTGTSAAIFSLEMSRDQLMQRMISARARIDSQRLRSGQLSDGDMSRLGTAADALHRLPLMIDDSSSLTVLDIRSKARQVAKEKGLGLIIIDYVGLIRPVKQQAVREREIAEISRSLKALAKELHVPVVVACQLNRALESGATPRKPLMSDLRESGALEQDADLVLFPWRESALCPACKEANGDCGKGHFRTAEIVIGKQRNGPTGTIKTVWLPEFSQFAPISDRE